MLGRVDTQSKPTNSEKNARDVVEAVSKWGLVTFAGLAGLGALVRMLPSEVPVLQRTDQTTLLYLTVAGTLLLLHRIRTFSFGELKFELIEKLQERQFRQDEKIDDIALMLPLLLPDKEIKHLKNLANATTEKYRGSHALRGELRRLRSMGLLTNHQNRPIGEMKDGSEFDLANYVELTQLGRRWALRIQDLEETGDVVRGEL